jgi:hypothetical protein
MLTLDAATQRQSGIRTMALAATSRRTEIAAYATVLDLQPLLALRLRYASALADAAAAHAAALASRADYTRSLALYRDRQIVSLQTMQATQARNRADQARAQSTARAVQSIRDETGQAYGATLARWALARDAVEFAPFLQQRAALLRVALPYDDADAAPLRIQVLDERNRRLAATRVGPAAQSDPAFAGRAYFYRVASLLAGGSRLSAYLPTAPHATAGVVIPADAVVWYGGQAWAYVQRDTTHFGRYPVASDTPTADGFFVREGFAVGQRVVVRGAQLLLSEALRPPPGGSGCKDPECD